MASGQIVKRKLEDIKPYENNARTHSQEQVKKIAASIEEFGFNNPVLIDGKGVIIAGHGRVLAAESLGMDTVPTIELKHLSKAQRKAYIIADNKIALDASWDIDLLRIEFDSLKDLGFDLEFTGFGLDEIKGLTGLIEEAEFPSLADGEKEPFQQKTFTLHDEQVAIVDDAIALAKTNPLYDTGLNENSNGNALAFICEAFLK